ncbi:MAG: ribbon-helix-helix domain-containing protein, partial [Pseudomonadota bacterium]|nr:ribbon-helix-helix domain-containing protein [Pseudomonadota bacterium]
MGLTVTSLISRNIYVNGHRTSMRLEPEVWRALEDIAGFESQAINALCTL